MPIGSATALRPPDAYLAVAAAWPLVVRLRKTERGHALVRVNHLERRGQPFRQVHLDCEACGQSVYCLASDATQDTGHALTAGDIAARVLAHLKTSHDDALPRT